MIKFEKIKTNLHSKSYYDISDSEFCALFNNFETIIEILKLEPQNRVNLQVKELIPFISKIPYFYDFLIFNETEQTLQKFLIEFCWLLTYENYEKNKIIQKIRHPSDNFYLIISGNIAVLDLILTNECLTEEEYIIFLIKMYLLKETEIIKICLKYNKKILNVNNENIQNFCESGYQFKYKELKIKAISELSKYNFNIEKYQDKIPSLDNYISLTKIETKENQKGEEKQFKKYFIIPHYEKVAEFKRGRNIGDLCKINNFKNIEKYTFVAIENSIIGIIRKLKYDRPLLFNPIIIKKEFYIKNILKKFFIFQDSDINLFSAKFSKYFIFKKYLKGEKIISQNSIYDGVYLLVNGNVMVTTNRTLDELNGLTISFQNALDNFNDYLSFLKTEEINNGNEDFIRDPIYSTSEYNLSSKGIKKIFIIELFCNEIIGTNEFYNYKNNLNYFDVTISTGQATIIFIPKLVFHEMISHEINVRNALIKKVEFKVKLFTAILLRYKKDFMILIRNKILQKTNNYRNNFFNSSIQKDKLKIKKKTLSLSPLNSIIKNSSPILKNSSQKNLENSKYNELTDSKVHFTSNNNSIYTKKILSVNNSRNNFLNNSKSVNTLQSKDNIKKKLDIKNIKNKKLKFNIEARVFLNDFPFTVIDKKEDLDENKPKLILPLMRLNKSKSSTKKHFYV
jgi:CRP-like cAMP-binding protein